MRACDGHSTGRGRRGWKEVARLGLDVGARERAVMSGSAEHTWGLIADHVAGRWRRQVEGVVAARDDRRGVRAVVAMISSDMVCCSRPAPSCPPLPRSWGRSTQKPVGLEGWVN